MRNYKKAAQGLQINEVGELIHFFYPQYPVIGASQDNCFLLASGGYVIHLLMDKD